MRAASRSDTVRNDTPRGAQSHLYAWQTTASKTDASTGSQPTAWVASHSVSAPCCAAAVTMAAASATSPVADCTTEKATRAVLGRTCAARSRRGAVRTTRPRPECTKGSTIDENSPSGTSTSAPSGSADATIPAATEVCEPIATRSAPMPTRDANSPRERSTAAQ